MNFKHLLSFFAISAGLCHGAMAWDCSTDYDCPPDQAYCCSSNHTCFNPNYETCDTGGGQHSPCTDTTNCNEGYYCQMTSGSTSGTCQPLPDCEPGYFGLTTCAPCPVPGTSSFGSFNITQCYIPAGQIVSDNTGKYKYASKCYYK